MSDKDPIFTPEQQEHVDSIVTKRLERASRSQVASINEMRERYLDPPAEARVTHEPRVYALDSPNSYYCDVIMTAQDRTETAHPSARQRLNRYATELAYEIEQRSPEGLRAERLIRERTRVEDENEHEQRATRQIKEMRGLLTSGGGTTSSASGGQAAAFVAPAFLMDAAAMFRGAQRPFADQCLQLPLPRYGMQVYLPYFVTTDSESQSTELAGMSETDPTTALQGSPVVTLSGQLTMTQQLYDRFAGGGTADVLFARDLRQRLNEKVDIFALNQVIAGGSTVTDAGPLTANSLKEVYQDFSKAREQLTDTAGTRLRPTHVFTTYDLYSGLSDIMGTDGRPMLVPTYAPGFPIVEGADTDTNAVSPAWSRFTGTVLPGGLLWFTDDNIPASGANTQILVTAPKEAVVLCESAEPVLAVFPQTYANNLAVVVTLYEYAACITKHASGTAVITGNAYPTTLKS